MRQAIPSRPVALTARGSRREVPRSAGPIRRGPTRGDRLLAAVRRHPSWLGPVPLAAILTLLVAATLVDRTSQDDAGGQLTKAVAVAARDLEVGAAVAEGDIIWRTLPAGAVAERAVTRDKGSGAPVAVAGRIVTSPIAHGEPIVATRLAPEGVTGLAALIPGGATAIAIPSGPGTPPVGVGQRVEIYGPATGGSASLWPPTGAATERHPEARRLTTAAVVVQVDDSQITVAVRHADVAAVSAALLDGAVVVVITG